MATSSRNATRPRASKVPREKIAFAQALAIFKKAAQRIPAYKDFLRKAKINPEKIETASDFARVPPTDKPSYISAYPLSALSWDGTLKDTKYVSSSSGSTGVPLYWPRGDRPNEISGHIFQNIFENILDSKEGSMLAVTLFSLGTWIAGLEFYNGAKFTADRGSSIALLTPGIEKSVALEGIVRLASSFHRLVLAGYPPFVKDVLTEGRDMGIDWKKYDVRLLTAGEAVSELWRARVLEMIGRPHSLTHSINYYGMAETGIIGHETPLTIFLRQNSAHMPALHKLLSCEGSTASLYQYNPLLRYFEVGENNTLMLTAEAGLPLIRYNTRDQGGILTHEEASHILGSEFSGTLLAEPSAWRDPMLYLWGRKDLSLSFYALIIYVENIKHCLESYPDAKKFSGLFSMRVGHTQELDQRFEITVEMARNTTPHRSMVSPLTEHVFHTLRSVNSEYAKLSAALGGPRTRPKITLVSYGQLDTLPGRKHRWVKRS